MAHIVLANMSGVSVLVRRDRPADLTRIGDS